MFTLLPIILLLISPLAMLAIRMVNPKFGYHWLIAAGGSLAAWVFALANGMNLPQTIQIASWQPGSVVSTWPVLLVDRISWPYALALASLVLAVIFTDVARIDEVGWSSWSGSMFLAGLGMIAVFAANPITLLLAWTAIDLLEMAILFSQTHHRQVRERVVGAFTARVFGSILVIGALMYAGSQGQGLTFTTITPQVGGLLVLAAGLRLGVLPLYVPFTQDLPLRRGLGTITRLVPAAASLILLARTATAQADSTLAPYLLGLAALAALISGGAWLLAKDELEGRPVWILGMASLSLASAVKAEPAASLAWGIAGLLGGGLLFLFSHRDARLSWLPGLALIGLSGLPFTPNWNGMRLFISPFDATSPVFLIAYAFLLVGYVRHSLRPVQPITGVERWVWFIYPMGLAILPTTFFLFGWLTNPPMKDMPIAGWFAGLVIIGLAVLMHVGIRRSPRVSSGFVKGMKSFFSMLWIYQYMWRFYRVGSRGLSYFTTVMEGEGGVLWTLLLLVLLVSMLVINGG
jgi:hypothetical protein